MSQCFPDVAQGLSGCPSNPVPIRKAEIQYLARRDTMFRENGGSQKGESEGEGRHRYVGVHGVVLKSRKKSLGGPESENEGGRGGWVDVTISVFDGYEKKRQSMHTQ